MPSPPPGMSVCFRCGECKPVGEFVKRASIARGHTRDCKACHTRAVKLRQYARLAEKRDHQKAREFRAALTAIREAETDTRVRLLVSGLVERIGGMEKLLGYWGDVIESDLQRGGYPAWRHIGAVLRLMEHLESVQPKPSEMSDEELEARVAALTPF